MYAIKIYEVLNAYMDDNNKPHADVAIEISISIEELRRVTDTTKKFERYSNFKKSKFKRFICTYHRRWRTTY